MDQKSEIITGGKSVSLNGRVRWLIFLLVFVGLGVTIYAEALYALLISVIQRHGSSHSGGACRRAACRGRWCAAALDYVFHCSLHRIGDGGAPTPCAFELVGVYRFAGDSYWSGQVCIKD